MDNAKKARAVGLNHVALEVGDIGEALAFYRRLFDFNFRLYRSVRSIPGASERSYPTCRRRAPFRTGGRRQGCGPQSAG